MKSADVVDSVTERPVLEFGRRYVRIACFLEGLAGGDGPYGNQKIFFDSWAKKRTELPNMYRDYVVTQIRKYARLSGRARSSSGRDRLIEERNMDREVLLSFCRKDVPFWFDELEYLANEIADPVKKQTRIDQVNGMRIFYDVLRSDIKPGNHCPSYHEIVERMTGISPAMIPSQEELDARKGEASGLLSAKEYDSHEFTAQVVAWRNNLKLLSKKEMLDMYRQGVECLVDAIRLKHGFPEEARVKVIEPDSNDSFRSGSFDYGRGGPYRAESRIIPDDTSTLIDVASTVAHEIGGHYMLSVLWDKYHRSTDDLFGAIGTMCSNIAITQEGIASHGIIFHEKELSNIYGNNIMEDMRIAQKLEELAMMMLPYEVDRKESTNITKEQMKKEFVEYGVPEGRAERRASNIFEPSRKPRVLAYTGTSYGQGNQYIGQLIEQYGAKRVLEACTEPISLVALSKSLE